MKTIGLALGSGGAKGLAHLPVLQALDELGLRPTIVSGASIGAVVGAMYASGLSGMDIHECVQDLLGENGRDGEKRLFKRDYSQLLALIDPSFSRSGLLKGENILKNLAEAMQVARFEELDIPLKVVASDFWEREQVVLDSGELLPAIRASMALPGIFTPVRMGERILIDGGAVNPIPYDVIQDQCDFTIAVDVMGKRTPGETPEPDFMEAVFNTFQIMERSILLQKYATRRPDVVVEMDASNVKMLEFHKAEEIYAQAAPRVEYLKRELDRLL